LSLWLNVGVTILHVFCVTKLPKSLKIKWILWNNTGDVEGRIYGLNI